VFAVKPRTTTMVAVAMSAVPARRALRPGCDMDGPIWFHGDAASAICSRNLREERTDRKAPDGDDVRWRRQPRLACNWQSLFNALVPSHCRASWTNLGRLSQ